MESPQASLRPVKKRKATYLVRKEEAENLKDQISELQSQLQRLVSRAQQAAMSPSDHLQLLQSSVDTRHRLKQLLLQQQLVVAEAQAKFQVNQSMNPLYTYIHLPKDWEERRRQIESYKDDMLARAAHLALARFSHLNPLAKYSSVQRYEDEQGGVSGQHFRVMHIVGATSLKQVYDAAKFFLTNVEITTSEALGYITVREDYDVEDDESSGNFRLISGRPNGLVTESNKVLYNKYYEAHGLFGGRPCGIMVTDSVDYDDKYPYDPRGKVRLDVSATLVITEAGMDHQLYGKESVSAPQEAVDQGLVVGIQCMSFMKIRRPEFDVPEDAVYAIADGLENWVKVMLKTVREHINAS